MGMSQIVRLPLDGFVRLRDILQLIPVGKSSWWAGVKSGRYPQSVKLGARTTVWRVEDIRRLIQQGVSQTAKPSAEVDQVDDDTVTALNQAPAAHVSRKTA